ncbi:MAG: hypothetical protein KFF72_03035, partial [Arthrospira sp. SH-MAG29]|nr:hypothetical protein [Arthrospira sp. SH-MAG29]
MSAEILKDNGIGVKLSGNLHNTLRDNLPDLAVDVATLAIGMGAEAFLEASTVPHRLTCSFRYRFESLIPTVYVSGRMNKLPMDYSAVKIYDCNGSGGVDTQVNTHHIA